MCDIHKYSARDFTHKEQPMRDTWGHHRGLRTSQQYTELWLLLQGQTGGNYKGKKKKNKTILYRPHVPDTLPCSPFYLAVDRDGMFSEV